MPEATLDIDAARRSMDAAFRTEGKKPAPDPTIQRAPDPKISPASPEVAPKPPVPPDFERGGVKGMRAEIERAQAELKETKAKLAEFEGTKAERDKLKSEYEAIKTDFEKTTQERDGLKKIESVAALERSPEFQAKYTAGREKLTTRLQQLAEMSGVAPAELASAISKTGKDRYTALEEVVGSAPRMLQDDLLRTIRDLDNLDAERYDELTKAEQIMQERIKERETGDRRTREERAKIRDTAWQETAATLGKELGLTDEQLATGKAFLTTNKDARKASEMIVRGIAADGLRKRLADAMEEIKGYQNGTPGVRAGAHGKTGTDEKPPDMPLSQWMNEQAKRAIDGRR